MNNVTEYDKNKYLKEINLKEKELRELKKKLAHLEKEKESHKKEDNIRNVIKDFMNMLPELSQEKINVLKGIDARPNPEIMNYIRSKNNTNELNASVARIYASRGYKPGEKLYGSINLNSKDYSHSFNKTDYLLFSFYVPIHKFDI